MVTCSRCFAKHSAKIAATATDCARVCIRDGANFSFVNGDRTSLLQGEPTELKRVAGQRVQIVGALSGGTITVASVATGLAPMKFRRPHFDSLGSRDCYSERLPIAPNQINERY
jgi:hypothetical protein